MFSPISLVTSRTISGSWVLHPLVHPLADWGGGSCELRVLALHDPLDHGAMSPRAVARICSVIASGSSCS